MKYLIILEPTNNGFCAYSPDIDGCIAAAETRDETITLMREAIEFHLEGMIAAGYPLPTSQSESAIVEIGALQDVV